MTQFTGTYIAYVREHYANVLERAKEIRLSGRTQYADLAVIIAAAELDRDLDATTIEALSGTLIQDLVADSE